MLEAEAQWFRASLDNLDPAAVFPMLDLGSSTQVYRERTQPWIEACLFRPIKETGNIVKHADRKMDPGVDIVGDVSNPASLAALADMGFQSVLCANMLEVVANREEVCRWLVSSVPIGGYLFISCPVRCPYHPEPLDTMFRPMVEELARLFPGTRMQQSATVTEHHVLLYYLLRQPTKLVRMLIRIGVPFYKPRFWLAAVRQVPWWPRRLQATCVVLQRVV